MRLPSAGAGDASLQRVRNDSGGKALTRISIVDERFKPNFRVVLQILLLVLIG